MQGHHQLNATVFSLAQTQEMVRDILILNIPEPVPG
jgi:hypothetical protein